jgi:hypothetical protein
MQKFFKKSWQGLERLWRVIVFGWLLIGIGTAFIGAGLKTIDSKLLIIIFAFLYLAYLIWLFISAWRCAFNSTWRGWGYIVRVIVMVGAIAAVLELVLMKLN